MYSNQEVSAIHRELQTLCKKSLVLLGGSYWYGGAKDNSDLDFYLILPWWQWLKYHILKNNLFKFKNHYPLATIMIIPKILYKIRWYYVIGRDTQGNTYCQYNRGFFLRQTLKLAWQSYVTFKKSGEQANLFKCAQGMAGAHVVFNKQEIQPIMKPQNLTSALISSQAPEFLKTVLHGKYQNIKILKETDIKTVQEQCLQLLTNLTNRFLKITKFSILSYLVYNIRFISRANFSFIFGDPDLNILKLCLNKFTNMETLYIKLKTAAFPVIVI